MTHRLHHGDALSVCQALPADVGFDLVYLDPPYGVGATMTARGGRGETRGRKTRKGGRDAYHDSADVDALVALLERTLAAVRDRMRSHGMLYLHLDYRAAPYARVAVDKLFGRRSFVAEVIWTPGNGARGARGLSVTHQNILVYCKAEKKHALHRTDHPLLREPYAETSLSMHFTKQDEDGRRYRERKVNGKTYRYYADEGRRLGSVWTDIPAMVANSPLRKEGTGYPTQKPERLLERIVRAASHEGDTVADLMCGSGTTLVVADALDRRFVGGDQSPVAIATTRARLEGRGVDYTFVDESATASLSAASMPAGEALPDPATS